MPPTGYGMLAMGAMGVLFLFLHQIQPFTLASLPVLTIAELAAFIGGAAFLGSDEDEDDTDFPDEFSW